MKCYLHRKENCAEIREMILNSLSAIGVVPDLLANEERGKEVLLTKPESKVPVWAVLTNEELAIARETARLV